MNPSRWTWVARKRFIGLVGLVGLLAPPAVLLADTFFAIRRGWRWRDAGPLIVVPAMCALAVVFSLALSIIPPCRRWLAPLAALSLSLTLAILLGEGLLLYVHPAAPIHARRPLQSFEHHPDPSVFPGTTAPARHSTNRWGLRGVERTEATKGRRILLLGGGAIEGVLLDDDKTVGADLARDLSTPTEAWQVLSAGRTDASVSQHREFLQRSPVIDQGDVVVVMAGFNELVWSLMNRAPSAAGPSWFESHLIQWAREWWNLRLGQGTVIDDDGKAYAIARMGLPMDERVRDRERELADFKFEIESLIASARQRGVQLILVTQPVLWDELLSPMGKRRLHIARVFPYPRDWSEINPTALREDIDRLNAVVRDVSRRDRIVLVDAAADMNGIETLFISDELLSVAGARRLAELIAQAVRSLSAKRA